MSVNVSNTGNKIGLIINQRSLVHIEAVSIGYPPRSDYWFGVFVNGTIVHQAGRGWGITVFNSSLNIIAANTFDTLGTVDQSNAQAAINYFSFYNKDQNLICVHTQDEPVFYSGLFKNYLSGASVGFKTPNLANAYRGAWCGIYQHGKGPLAEESSAIWTSGARRVPQGDNNNARCCCNATLVF
jgi:hypothetical protein